MPTLFLQTQGLRTYRGLKTCSISWARHSADGEPFPNLRGSHHRGGKTCSMSWAHHCPWTTRSCFAEQRLRLIGVIARTPRLGYVFRCSCSKHIGPNVLVPGGPTYWSTAVCGLFLGQPLAVSSIASHWRSAAYGQFGPAIGGQQHNQCAWASHWRSAAYGQFGDVETSPSVKPSNRKTVNNKTGCISCVSFPFKA